MDQIYEDFEIIVDDDASTDETEEVVKSFTDGTARLTISNTWRIKVEQELATRESRLPGDKFIGFLDSTDE